MLLGAFERVENPCQQGEEDHVQNGGTKIDVANTFSCHAIRNFLSLVRWGVFPPQCVKATSTELIRGLVIGGVCTVQAQSMDSRCSISSLHGIATLLTSGDESSYIYKPLIAGESAIGDWMHEIHGAIRVDVPVYSW